MKTRFYARETYLDDWRPRRNFGKSSVPDSARRIGASYIIRTTQWRCPPYLDLVILVDVYVAIAKPALLRNVLGTNGEGRGITV